MRYALWGGYIKCLDCVANKMSTADMCHELQDRGQCIVKIGEAKMLQSDSGMTARIQLDECHSPIDSAKWCSDLLQDLCRHIGMNPLAGPFSETLVHPTDPLLSGVSSVLIIQESHLAIHTWPETGAIRIVIDTCGDGLSVQEAQAWLMKRVGAQSSRVFISRIFGHTRFR